MVRRESLGSCSHRSRSRRSRESCEPSQASRVQSRWRSLSKKRAQPSSTERCQVQKLEDTPSFAETCPQSERLSSDRFFSREFGDVQLGTQYVVSKKKRDPLMTCGWCCVPVVTRLHRCTTTNETCKFCHHVKSAIFETTHCCPSRHCRLASSL